eukprot:1160440-Pelagomonas_calceolata.AAC.2
MDTQANPGCTTTHFPFTPSTNHAPLDNKHFAQLRMNHAGAIVPIGTQDLSKCKECPETIQDAVV